MKKVISMAIVLMMCILPAAFADWQRVDGTISLTNEGKDSGTPPTQHFTGTVSGGLTSSYIVVDSKTDYDDTYGSVGVTIADITATFDKVGVCEGTASGSNVDYGHDTLKFNLFCANDKQVVGDMYGVNDMSGDMDVEFRGYIVTPTAGPQGEQGIQGEQGPQGETGPAGADGEDGNCDCENLCVDGEQGPQGETGPQGPQGDQGETGPQGEKGDKGDTGDQGPQGDQGETGPAGANGQDGADGEDGADGFNCWDLNQNYVCDLTTEDTNFDLSCDVLDCRGAQGDKGDTGDEGPEGPVGPQGPQGPAGNDADINDLLNAIFVYFPGFEIFWNSPKECTDSQTKCVGADLYTCSDYAYGFTQTCPNGCTDGACNKENCKTKANENTRCQNYGSYGYVYYNDYGYYKSCQYGHGSSTECEYGFCKSKEKSTYCQWGCDDATLTCKPRPTEDCTAKVDYYACSGSSNKYSYFYDYNGLCATGAGTDTECWEGYCQKTSERKYCGYYKCDAETGQCI